MNQEALEMVEKLTARLKDVREVIEECPREIEGLAKRLDRIDDQLYLVMVDVEKATQNHCIEAEKRQSKVVPLDINKGSDEFNSSLADENLQASVKTKRVDHGSDSVSSDSKEKEESHQSFFSDEVKENMKEGARALNGIYQDGKEVVSELSDAMSDIKNVFNITNKFKR